MKLVKVSKLWEIYTEILKWKGYIYATAKSQKIEPEDLLDSVLAYIIEYKDTDIKNIIKKKAYELKYRKEIAFSALEHKEDDKENNIIDMLQYLSYKKHTTEAQESECLLDKLPADLKEYLIARVRIEKTLPLKERIQFKKKLEEARKILHTKNQE